LVDSFFFYIRNGNALNSPNDISISSTGEIYFTDPPYGYEQGFRGAPVLGAWLYKAKIAVEDDEIVVSGLRPISDGFSHPNGVALSNDEKTLYVSDTGYQNGDGTIRVNEPRAIYAFDLRDNGSLSNRRVLAIVDKGYPDGIKVRDGMVWAGCGDGVHVFDEETGDLQFKLVVEGGVANLEFGAEGELYVLNECRIFSIHLE
jgi:gluconolactonase